MPFRRPISESERSTCAALYPDTTAGIAYSQSVNVTAYLTAAVFGGLYLLTLLLFRKRTDYTSARSESS